MVTRVDVYAAPLLESFQPEPLVSCAMTVVTFILESLPLRLAKRNSACWAAPSPDARIMSCGAQYVTRMPQRVALRESPACRVAAVAGERIRR